MRVAVDEWNHERQKELLSQGWEFEGYIDGRIFFMKREDEHEDFSEFAFPPLPPSTGDTRPPHERIMEEMPTRADYEEACLALGITPLTDNEIQAQGEMLVTGYPYHADNDPATNLHVKRLILLEHERFERSKDRR